MKCVIVYLWNKKQNNMSTKSVYTSQSQTTGKTLVKMSNVTYGHIDNNTLYLTRNATDMVMHSLLIFAEKNNLTITQ